MKRLIALVLVVLMLGSTAAFADVDTMLGVSAETNSMSGENSTVDGAKTELWLQVDADGQIDVTVPLVLVFRTNIDGGVADTASNYKLKNNSTSDVVVTTIATAHETDNNTSQPMSIVAYTETPTEDQYKVQLSVADAVAVGTKDAEGKEIRKWDLATTSHTAAPLAGGLFELPKATANGAGTDTIVKVDMTTGKLSFVTKRDANDDLDATQGVKLLTVTYTVAIDTSDAIGSQITTETAIDPNNIVWNNGTDNPDVVVDTTPDDDTQGG